MRLVISDVVNDQSPLACRDCLIPFLQYSHPQEIRKELRATSHLESGLLCCGRGPKSSLVIGQKAEIGANSFYT